MKWLLIGNTTMFVVDYFAQVFFLTSPFGVFGLVPREVISFGHFWQLATYMFLHADFWHILMNMLSLWMFGSELERDWGTWRFLKYYLLCGVGAGFCVIASTLFLGGVNGRTIGASGATYGLLLAFGMRHPDRLILFNFLFPIKAKYFVMIVGVMAFMSSFSTGSGISHVAHLGGMLFGYFYLKASSLRFTSHLQFGLKRRYLEWKLARTRKRFQAYMRRQD